MPKLIPPATGDQVFVPDLSHKYFEASELHPFQPDAPGFALANAWWLAEAALLAYADQVFAREKFMQAGLQLAGEQPLTAGKSTQCYVVHNDRIVIVAFRGSEFRRLNELTTRLQDVASDWLTDGKFTLVKFAGGGSVHSGFLGALDEVWTKLENAVEALRKVRPERPVWFTGHSLGGALAQLAAARWGKARAVYTFGAPMTGDAEFAAHYRITHYRVVNNNDGVAGAQLFGRYRPFRLMPGFYQHTGEWFYLDSSNQLQINPPLSQRFSEGLRGSAQQLLDAARRLAAKREFVLPVDQLNDHIPTYYALHLWNNYEKSLSG